MPTEHSVSELRTMQRRAFDYFPANTNPDNGLVADSTRPSWPCSIASVGFALSCYPIAIERGWTKRGEALKKILAALRFFANSEQSAHHTASGHRGFYYHFLGMKSGKRVWKCELSTIDSTLLFYGMLAAAQYFDRDSSDEKEVRERVEALVSRADWRWVSNQNNLVALAWKPEHIKRRKGFSKWHWCGYNEGLLLYILALGAKEHSLSKRSYDAWCETYRWKKLYGIEHLYAGPLFIHQFPHLWLDLRHVRDEWMRKKNWDYFQNSRRATLLHQEYSRRNPHGFAGYNEWCWGLTAGDGPGHKTKTIANKRRQFWAYRARGAPFGPDDGTLAPWAMLASLPFAPDIVLPSLRYIEKTYPQLIEHCGLLASFNPTWGGATNTGWIAPYCYGIDQGPVVMAIENHLSGFMWRLLRENKIIQHGLERAGFEKF